jgi:hypothetical protein
MGQKRLMTVHALDALFLYGNDVRKLHYTDRSVVVRMVKLCIPIKFQKTILDPVLSTKYCISK